MQAIFIGSTGPTPIGDLWVAVAENGLVAVDFPTSQEDFTAWLHKRYNARVEFAPQAVEQFTSQLREYASGQRRNFTLPVDWTVLNEFQRKALQATYAIPYGETRTYKEVALEIGSPRGARAVGRAEATNPMPVILPCHRVIGVDRKLHGYGAGDGLDTKVRLLKLEGAINP
jgi:methylated-DNA-[protein]-cysteine S-methyltransferase